MRGIDMHIGNVGYFCVGASGGGIDLASGIVEVKRFILQRLLLLSLSLVMLVCVGYSDNHNHGACLFALTSRHAEAAAVHLDIKELLADLQAPVDHLRVEKEIFSQFRPPLSSLPRKTAKSHDKATFT